MASAQYQTTKILFVLCNCFFLIMGVAMVIIGAYLKISRSDYVDLMSSDEFFTGTALLISSGTIVVVVCLFGFIGVWMQSQCIILIYLLCVLVVLALAVTSGIIGFVFHGDIDEELREKMLEGLRDKNKRNEWDNIQTAQRCCGVTNYTDWHGLIDPDYPTNLPDSCCDGPNCGSQGKIVAYDTGCYEMGKEWITDNFYSLGASGIVLGFLQLILLAAGLGLIIMMRREKGF